MKKTIYIVLMLLMLGLVSAQLEIAEIRVAKWTDNLFALSTNQGSYKRGETAEITDVQNVNGMCDELLVRIKVFDDTSKIVANTERNLGEAGWFNAFVRMYYDTSDAKAGVYIVESNWYCTQGNTQTKLGKDGYIDENTQPSRIVFEVIGESDPDPEPTCTKTCQDWQELKNPNSPDCYCEYTWEDNNGVCEDLEPSWTSDCDKLEPQLNFFEKLAKDLGISVTSVYVLSGIIALVLVIMLVAILDNKK